MLWTWGALAPTAVASLAIQRLAGRSQACVSLGMQKRVHEGSVHMALCGDRGAGGASARSQRAPARSRARERVPDQAWVSSRGVRREHEERSWRGANTTAKFQGDKKVSGMPNVAREPERMGWCDAHAEGSGVTSQDRGNVAGRRGSHNDSTLAS